MQLHELIGRRLLFIDGATGTMLQKKGLLPGEAPDLWSVSHPDDVLSLHRSYLDAGCDIITANTFGCNAKKLEGSGHSVKELVTAAVGLVRKAIDSCEGEQPKFAALDLGPTGKLLKPLGDLDFEDAVGLFSEPVRAGADAGADLILIETMSDMYELKAAVLAAKENCSLPVMATVALDISGKLLTGGDISSVVALLEGLRVDALGLNCGLGPAQMLPILAELREICSIPVILNPNAGLPRVENGETIYDVGPDEFAEIMADAARNGAHLLGGCCGTTPEHISALVKACDGITPMPVTRKNRTVVSSYGRTVSFDGGTVIIGERINPTGKPKLKQALRDGDMDYVLREGLKQQSAGAQILDVNAGLPGINESDTLAEMVVGLQSVTDLPLQLDTSDPKALEKSLRLYNGKAMVNSVSGKDESMKAVFPLVQRYGGLVVALTLDEKGIPETAEGRVQIARRILERAAEYGIEKKDIIFDPLTTTISTADNSALFTLEALRKIKNELGAKTSLGVSNISFGLPKRELLNASFFTLAMGAGLDAAIINPLSQSMMDAYYTTRTLLADDPQCSAFITRYGGETAASVKITEANDLNLEQAIRQGLKNQSGILAKRALEAASPLDVIEDSIMPALNQVGEEFEAGRLFLPQLLMSAEAAKAAFEVVRARMGSGEGSTLGCVVLATVKGDIHDIGKNIVKALLENYRFRVIDLGRDVPPEDVVSAVIKHRAKVVGLSALMTTTMPSMELTIKALRKETPECKIMVGGAVLTKEYAEKIGADFYGRDAMASVRFANQVYN